jgi:hypothetical protein
MYSLAVFGGVLELRRNGRRRQRVAVARGEEDASYSLSFPDRILAVGSSQYVATVGSFLLIVRVDPFSEAI